MYTFIARLAPVVALLLVVSGCNGSDLTDDVAPDPTPTVTESFQDVLAPNGGITHPFTATGGGAITAQLVSLAPDAVKPIGLSMGTWNGSTCQIILANDLSIQGTAVTGQATAAGNFCIRVYDAAGTVTELQTYVVEVTHQ